MNDLHIDDFGDNALKKKKKKKKESQAERKRCETNLRVLTALTTVSNHYFGGTARDREVAFPTGRDRKRHSHLHYCYYPPLYYTNIKSRRIIGDRKEENRHFTGTRILFNNSSARYLHSIHKLLICNY